MAKCNQLTYLPVKGLTAHVHKKKWTKIAFFCLPVVFCDPKICQICISGRPRPCCLTLMQRGDTELEQAHEDQRAEDAEWGGLKNSVRSPDD